MKIIYDLLTKIIRPFFGSGIGRYFPFNIIYKIHKKLQNKVYYNNSQDEIIFRTIHGFNMFLKKGKFIDENILSFGEWEPKITQIIKQSLKRGDVFLDLGANIGYYSLLASQLVGDEGKVIAFEPSKIIYKDLQKNIKLNGFKNIVTYNLGVGEKEEELKLFYNDSNPGGSSIVNNVGDKYEIINIVKLDDFLKNQKINFIKMDIEGYEYFAFNGMINILRNNDLEMVFEYNPKIYEKIYKNESINKSVQFLIELNNIGFELFQIEHYNGRLSKIYDFRSFYNKIYNGSGGADIFCIKNS